MSHFLILMFKFFLCITLHKLVLWICSGLSLLSYYSEYIVRMKSYCQYILFIVAFISTGGRTQGKLH